MKVFLDKEGDLAHVAMHKGVRLSLKLGQEKKLVSQTRAHKYVDSLLPHSPKHAKPNICLFFISCQEKRMKKISRKKWEKNKQTHFLISYCSFSKKKKKKA